MRSDRERSATSIAGAERRVSGGVASGAATQEAPLSAMPSGHGEVCESECRDPGDASDGPWWRAPDRAGASAPPPEAADATVATGMHQGAATLSAKYTVRARSARSADVVRSRRVMRSIYRIRHVRS
jgi:hypothetical protein